MNILLGWIKNIIIIFLATFFLFIAMILGIALGIMLAYPLAGGIRLVEETFRQLLMF